MEKDFAILCTTCSKRLPISGFFCGGCLTQYKCKKCDALLEKDSIGCISCGTPKESRNNTTVSNASGFNTFRLQETATERTIEATFSDNVGKELTGILRDAYSNRPGGSGRNAGQISNGTSAEGDKNVQDAEVLPDKAVNESTDQMNAPTVSPQNYPELIAIAMKNLPSSETEWVVVYSFYASDFGKAIFTRQDIILKYEESRRKTNEKLRGLSACIKSAVKSGLMTPLQDSYSILEKGVIAAKEIISRTSSSGKKSTRNSGRGKSRKNEAVSEGNGITSNDKKKTSTSGKNLKRLTNIDFVPKGKESLESFYKKFASKSDLERNLLFVFYLEEILEIKGITYDHIYTCYDSLDLNISENLQQTVRNTKSKKGWIETSDAANITVTIKGRNKIKSWNKKD